MREPNGRTSGTGSEVRVFERGRRSRTTVPSASTGFMSQCLNDRARSGALLLLLMGAASFAARADDASSPWKTIAKGFEVGRFETTQRAESGDSTITAIRIDPTAYSVELFSAVIRKIEDWPTGAQWLEQQNLAATINGGMFELDGRTTGFARQGDTIVNP